MYIRVALRLVDQLLYKWIWGIISLRGKKKFHMWKWHKKLFYKSRDNIYPDSFDQILPFCFVFLFIDVMHLGDYDDYCYDNCLGDYEHLAAQHTRGTEKCFEFVGTALGGGAQLGRNNKLVYVSNPRRRGLYSISSTKITIIPLVWGIKFGNWYAFWISPVHCFSILDCI